MHVLDGCGGAPEVEELAEEEEGGEESSEHDAAVALEHPEGRRTWKREEKDGRDGQDAEYMNGTRARSIARSSSQNARAAGTLGTMFPGLWRER